MRRRDRYDPRRGAPGPWLYGIAHVLLARHRRTEQRRLVAYARSGTEPISRPHDDDAVHRADAAVHGAALAGALARMSGRDRDVLLLFALADLGYAEIAQALDMPVGTVRSKLHRARRRLQVSLGPQVRSALNLDSRLSTRPATEVSR
ncbi:MAG: RNA polymerase sigma factor [Kineosporiaceae bacterium]